MKTGTIVKGRYLVVSFIVGHFFFELLALSAEHPLLSSGCCERRDDERRQRAEATDPATEGKRELFVKTSD